MFDTDDIIHDGVKKFWKSNAKDKSGINPNWAKRLRLALVHLASAQCISDLSNPEPKDWRFHKYTNTEKRYSIDVTGNYRLLFDLVDEKTGKITNINLLDPH